LPKKNEEVKKNMEKRSISKKTLVGVFAVLIACTLVASAGMLTHFGRINTTANVEQSVQLRHGGEWQNWNAPLPWDVNAVAGSCLSRKFLIRNQAEVEASIDLDTEVYYNNAWRSPDGLTSFDVNYYDLSSKLFVSEEVKELDGTSYVTTDHYPNNLLVEISHKMNCDIEFVVTTPTALEDGSQDNFAVPFDVDNNGYADFQVSFHANKDSHYSGDYWGFQIVDDGSWGGWQPVPTWITVSDVDKHVFTITFSSDVLGGIGSEYSFGVSGSFAASANQINSGQNVYFKYPLDFSWGTGWITSEDYELQQVGTPFTDYTLEPGEQLLFAIEYCFNLKSDPGFWTNRPIRTTIQ
jgi:hypothetical protein